MNLNPNNPTPENNDAAIDEALLDEALAEATPAELEAKILSLTDPQMLLLLDEALAPEPASDALTQRILAATGASGQPDNNLGDVAVLARIGPSTLRYAAAAAIALAVGLGVWFTNQDTVDTDSSIVNNDSSFDVVEDDATNNEPAWLIDAQYADATDFFDNETAPISNVLDDLADNLDDASITRDTLWAELDAYEAFLDDIES